MRAHARTVAHTHTHTHTRMCVCACAHIYPQGYSHEQTRNSYENADRQQEVIICINIEVITHQHFTIILALVLKCTYMAKAQLMLEMRIQN